MRSTMLVGIILVLLGGFLFVRGGSFTTQKDIVKVGDVKITAPDDHTVPNWVGPVVALAGLGLLVFGGVQKKA